MKGTYLTLALLASLILSVACGPTSTTEPSDEASIKLAPASALSPELRRLSPDIQEVYRFALANRDVLEKIPCYCGCGAIGHMNNYVCYVQSASDSGQVVFDFHGAG